MSLATAGIQQRNALLYPVAAPVHQLLGDGRLVLEGGAMEMYGFVVQVDASIVVRGQGEIHIRDGPSAHFETSCRSVDDNMAWIGRVVVRTDDPGAAPVGLDFNWQLQDNGEGDKAAPDWQSLLFPKELLPG